MPQVNAPSAAERRRTVAGRPAQAITPLNSAPAMELTVPVVIKAADTTLWERNKVLVIFRATTV
jgi:hypothetical protein